MNSQPRPTLSVRVRTIAGLFAALTAPLAAQVAPDVPEDVITLDAFQVTTQADQGYRAGNSVSATRIDTPIKNLPFAINAYTQQFITDIGARDLIDVVQYAPSVTSAGKEFAAGNASYSIRGFAQAPQRNGFVGERYVDTVVVERVEVVKGPASVLYGQVSPGGTVNYITKRPRPEAASSWTVMLGSYDYWRTELDVNRPLVGDSLLFRLNGSWENGFRSSNPSKSHTRVIAPTLSWKVNDRMTLIVDYSNFYRLENPPAYYIPNINVSRGPGSTAAYYTSTAPADQPIVGPYRLVGIDPGFLGHFPIGRDFNYASDNDRRRSEFESLNAELDIKLGANWTSRVNFNRGKMDTWHKLTGIANVYVYPSPSTGLTPAEFATAIADDPRMALQSPSALMPRRKRLQESYTDSKAVQGEITGRFDMSWGTLRPLIGVYWNEGIVTGRSRQSTAATNFPLWDLLNPATIDRDTDFDPADLAISNHTRSEAHDRAAYAVLNASLLDDRLTSVLGLRYNSVDSQTLNKRTDVFTPLFKATKATPQVGLGYHVRPDLLVYGSYSESFVLNAGSIRVDNVPISAAKPTTAKGYELGVKTSFLNGRISSTVSVYQIDQRDRRVTLGRFDPGGTVLQSDFQGTMDRNNGIEADITLSPLDNWQIYLSVSENDIRVREVPAGYDLFKGTHPEFSVKTMANLWTRYTFNNGALKGLWVGAGLNYTGKKAQRSNNPFQFLDPETLYNAAIGYDWTWEKRGMSARLNWQNIYNSDYSPANQQIGLPARIVLSLRVRL